MIEAGRMLIQSTEITSGKIHSADIEPKNGFHYLLINGVEAGRFDCMQKALAAREVVLQPQEMEGPER